jgi:hypothetical protein
MVYELMLACTVGKPCELGKSVDIQDADEHIFGLVLVNDWSGMGALYIHVTSERYTQHEIFKVWR